MLNYVISFSFFFFATNMLKLIQLIFFLIFSKVKYVGNEQERSLQMAGLNLINKTLMVQGARIAFSIWDVGGMLHKSC